MAYGLEEFLKEHGDFLANLPNEDLRRLGKELKELLEKRKNGTAVKGLEQK